MKGHFRRLELSSPPLAQTLVPPTDPQLLTASPPGASPWVPKMRTRVSFDACGQSFRFQSRLRPSRPRWSDVLPKDPDTGVCQHGKLRGVVAAALDPCKEKNRRRICEHSDVVPLHHQRRKLLKSSSERACVLWFAFRRRRFQFSTRPRFFLGFPLQFRVTVAQHLILGKFLGGFTSRCTPPVRQCKPHTSWKRVRPSSRQILPSATFLRTLVCRVLESPEDGIIIDRSAALRRRKPTPSLSLLSLDSLQSFRRPDGVLSCLGPLRYLRARACPMRCPSLSGSALRAAVDRRSPASRQLRTF